MSLTLEGVSKVMNGQTHIYPTDLERAGVQGDIGPVMNEESDPSFWLNQPGSPKARPANEDEAPVTIAYDELIKSWN